MTTPTDDQQPQEQPSEPAGATDADDGWTAPDPEPAETDTPVADSSAVDGDAPKPDDVKPEDAPKQPVTEKQPETELLKQETKTFRDKYAASKGEAATLRKVAMKLEANGLLDRDELAKDVGVDRKYLDAVIDKTELPEPGEDGHLAAVNRQMDEDFQNPTVQKALSRVYGTVAEQEELAKAFNFAMQGDAELKAKFQTVKPEDAIYLVLDEGKAALEDFRQFAETGGSAKALAAENRALKAEIAALKAPKVVTAPAETEQQQPSEELPPPKDAREAHLRSLLN